MSGLLDWERHHLPPATITVDGKAIREVIHAKPGPNGFVTALEVDPITHRIASDPNGKVTHKRYDGHVRIVFE